MSMFVSIQPISDFISITVSAIPMHARILNIQLIRSYP